MNNPKINEIKKGGRKNKFKTNKEIIKAVERKGVIDFKFILNQSKNKKQFKEILKHFGISNYEINKYLSDIPY